MTAADGEHRKLVEKVKNFEGKLATLTAINSALQAENDKLREQLAEAPATDAEEELAELQEEFARRLGQADKTIAELREDREKLKLQLQQSNQGGTNTAAKLVEKDELIASLRQEGERLSRKNGELEATVRKLRSSTREADGEKARLQARIASLENAVLQHQHTSTASSQQQQQHIDALESQLAELKRVHEAEMAAAQQAAADAVQQLTEVRGRADEAAAACEREAALSSSIAQLQSSFAAAAVEHDAKQEQLRKEIAWLEDQLRGVTAEKNEMEMKLVDSTAPLLKQITAMSAAASTQHAAAGEREQQLVARLQACEAEIATLRDAAAAASAQVHALEMALHSARDGAKAAAVRAAELQSQCDSEQRSRAALQLQCDMLQQQLAAQQQAAAAQRDEAAKKLGDLKERLWDAEQQLREASAVKLHPATTTSTHTAATNSTTTSAAAGSHGSTPTQDLQSAAMQQSAPSARQAGSSAQGLEDSGFMDDLSAANSSLVGLLAATSVSGRDTPQRVATNSRARASTAQPSEPQLELLHTQLAELERSNAHLAEQLRHALSRTTELERELASCSQVHAEYEALANRYQLCLEVLGERTQRVEELENDVKEMKHIFHEQYSVVVDELNALRGDAKHAPLTLNGSAAHE